MMFRNEMFENVRPEIQRANSDCIWLSSGQLPNPCAEEKSLLQMSTLTPSDKKVTFFLYICTEFT